MSAKTTELKPCPFCGSGNVRYKEAEHAVVCARCKARGSIAPDEEMAIRMWDERAGELKPDSWEKLEEDANLGCRDETLEVDSPHLMAGGTYALGGTTGLWLNVTYNYARHYHCLGERGIREIYGKTGAESIPMLKAAALRLGDDVSDDYWEATEGNAKRALLQLLAMARMRPDGVWDGD